MPVVAANPRYSNPFVAIITAWVINLAVMFPISDRHQADLPAINDGGEESLRSPRGYVVDSEYQVEATAALIRQFVAAVRATAALI